MSEQQNQPAPEPDYKERTEKCNEELQKLLAKYELVIVPVPKIHQGKIVADTVFVSSRQLKNQEEKQAGEKPLAKPGEGLANA